MSTWVSAAPVIGAGSLDGFAIGALMTGACALAITAPRRTRGRKVPSARESALAAEQSGWLCEHAMTAEAAGAGVTAEAAAGAGSAALAAAPALPSAAQPPGLPSRAQPPWLPSAAQPPGLSSRAQPPGLSSRAQPPGLPSGAMGPALPSEGVVPELVAAAVARGLVAEAVASALAAEAVHPALAAEAVHPALAAEAVHPALAAEAVHPALAAAVDPGPIGEAFGAGAERLARPEEFAAHGKRRPAAGRTARAAGGYRSRHRVGDPVPGSLRWDGAELVFADPELPVRTLGSGSARRAEARPLPRHAVPSVSFASRILSSRMTGLSAPRALATSARG
jgi:hypothetical protein